MSRYLKFSVSNPSLHVSRAVAIFSFDRKGINLPKGTTLKEIAAKQRAGIKINKVGGEIVEKMYEPLEFSEMVSYFSTKYNDTPENVGKNILTFFEKLQKTYRIKLVEFNSKNEINESNFRKTGSWEYVVPGGTVLELTYRCNHKCKHCYNNSSIGSTDEMKKDDIFLLLEELDELGVKVIELTGGEPTMHPDFEDILEKIFSYNFELIGILSNGTNLTKNICTILANNKDRVVVQIDLHGSSQDYVEWFTGNSKAYQLATESISKISNLGIPVRVVCNVTPMNIDQMFDIANTAKKLGATAVAFGPIAPMGRATMSQDLILSLDQKAFEKFGENMEVLLKEFGKEFVTTLEESPQHFLNCGAGSNNLTISPSFDVKICQMSGAVIGNLEKYGKLLESFLRDNSDLLESLSRTPAPNKQICGECENLWFCYKCITRGIMKAKEKGECTWKKLIVEKEPFLSKLFQSQ